jgi:octaprenyl-diphosphate synthase
MEKTRQIIDSELKIFERKFNEAVRSNVPLLDRIMRYIVKRKGKQMRPMFVFLSARMFGEIDEPTYRTAALIELLHTATLVHDDVVDDAMERRGFFSVNALWKNKIAVLVGDYLLSKGLLLSLNNKDFRILQILSDAVRDMSEGELLQIEKTRRLNIEESIYFEIIKRKTASLLASACAAGAYSTSGDEELTARMHAFGETIGIAFQIKDDLFDYGTEDVGKPRGIDIKEKKLTLPLIYTINHATPELRKRLIYLIKNHNTDKDAVQEVIQAVIDAGGISYAAAKMEEYRQKAFEILASFPESEAKSGLIELVNYTTDRKY